MSLRRQQEKLQAAIEEALPQLCSEHLGMPWVSVSATIGVSLPLDQVVLVTINKTAPQPDIPKKSGLSQDSDCDSSELTKSHRTVRVKLFSGSVSEGTEEHVSNVKKILKIKSEMAAVRGKCCDDLAKRSESEGDGYEDEDNVDDSPLNMETEETEGFAKTAAKAPETSARSEVVAPEMGKVVSPKTRKKVGPKTGKVVAPRTREVVAPDASEVVSPKTSEGVAPKTGKVEGRVTAQDNAVMSETKNVQNCEVVLSKTAEAVSPKVGRKRPRTLANGTDEVSGQTTVTVTRSLPVVSVKPGKRRRRDSSSSTKSLENHPEGNWVSETISEFADGGHSMKVAVYPGLVPCSVRLTKLPRWASDYPAAYMAKTERYSLLPEDTESEKEFNIRHS